MKACFELELGHDVPMDYDPECDDAVRPAGWGCTNKGFEGVQ